MVTTQDPLGGSPMLVAIVHLQTGPAAQVAEDFIRMSPAMSRHWREETRQFLWEALSSRALAGEVELRGVPASSNSAVAIDPMSLRGSKPDFPADTLYAAGINYHGVGVFLVGTPKTTETATAIKGRGGRKATHDWTRVAAEVVRIAHMEDLGSRQLLTTRMIDWCATNLDTHPDESSVRKYVASLCPADLPAE